MIFNNNKTSSVDNTIGTTTTTNSQVILKSPSTASNKTLNATLSIDVIPNDNNIIVNFSSKDVTSKFDSNNIRTKLLTLYGKNGRLYTTTRDIESISIKPSEFPARLEYEFITIVDDATGCEDVVTLTPTINATPIVSITGPATLCVNKANVFTSNSVGSTLGYSFLWTVLEDGLPFAVTGNTSSTFSFTPTSLGSYYDVMLTRTHTSGCSTNSNIIMREAVTCCTTLNV